MSTNRRYSDEEIAEILDRATEAPAEEGRGLSAGGGLTLAELQEIGREVGIPSERIERAAYAIDHPTPETVPRRAFMGTPISVGRTVELGRRLTDSEWARLVIDLRETFNARGRLREEGPFRSWSNGNLQALLEPTEAGERLRLRTLKSNAVPSLTLGAILLALVPVLLVATFLTGEAALQLPMLFAVVGGLLYGNSRVQLPRWAETRELQMQGVATRLVESIEASDRIGPGADA